MTQVDHKHPKSRPLAAAHSPTAIPAENQAPKIALRWSPRRCWKAEELVRKAIERAKAGDVAMLKFLLDRLLPRERLIKLDLPRIEFADDAVEALGKVMSDVAEGRMTPSEGAAVAPLINSCARAIEMADVVKRLDALEAQIKGGRAP